MHAQELSDPWLRAYWFCFHNFRNNRSEDIFKMNSMIMHWNLNMRNSFLLTTQVIKIQLNFLLKNIQSILLTLCSWLESSFLFMFSARVTEQTSSSSIFLLSNTVKKTTKCFEKFCAEYFWLIFWTLLIYFKLLSEINQVPNKFKDVQQLTEISRRLFKIQEQKIPPWSLSDLLFWNAISSIWFHIQ